MTTSGVHLAAVRERLLQFAATIPKEELFPTLEPGAAELVTGDPFAFILAAALDRGTKAEIIWTIPYWLRKELGHLDPTIVARMTREELSDAFSHIPKKPRYVNAAPQTALEVARLVSDQVGGRAELIWHDRTAQEVKRALRGIHGVGEGIASMAVILLHQCGWTRFPDCSKMDVKPDVHVRRVLYRLGVARSQDETEAVRAAARLNPDFPGAVDPSLWVIGRRWCKSDSAHCFQCSVNDLCARVGLRRTSP